jgi:hypothetical protein
VREGLGAVEEIMDCDERLARYYTGDDDVISVIALALLQLQTTIQLASHHT